MRSENINKLIMLYQEEQKFHLFSKLKQLFALEIDIHTKMAYNKYFKFLNYNEIYVLTEISFFKLLKSYDANKGASFKTYLNNFLKYRINDQIKKMIPSKQDALRNYFNLDKIKEISPKNQYIELRDFDLQDYINDVQLSSLEKQVFIMHFEGENLTKISKILEISYKASDNALQRAKKKLQKSIIFQEPIS